MAGNTGARWTTHISLQAELKVEHDDLVDSVLKKLKSTFNDHISDIGILDEFHMSLSRTFKMKINGFQALCELVKQKFENELKFVGLIKDVLVLNSNEENKYFLGFKIEHSDDLLACLDNVNDVLKNQNLPTYYKNPTFHVTFAYLNVNNQEKSFLKDMKEYVRSLELVEEISDRDLVLHRLQLKCGNKLYFVKLI